MIPGSRKETEKNKIGKEKEPIQGLVIQLISEMGD